MNKMRQPGYYWVNDGTNWEIAQCIENISLNKNEWLIPGIELAFYDENFEEIDETPIVRQQSNVKDVDDEIDVVTTRHGDIEIGFKRRPIITLWRKENGYRNIDIMLGYFTHSEITKHNGDGSMRFRFNDKLR